jgi:hypothetical protein
MHIAFWDTFWQIFGNFLALFLALFWPFFWPFFWGIFGPFLAFLGVEGLFLFRIIHGGLTLKGCAADRLFLFSGRFGPFLGLFLALLGMEHPESLAPGILGDSATPCWRVPTHPWWRIPNLYSIWERGFPLILEGSHSWDRLPP